MFKTAECRDCHEEVVWAKFTKKGASSPSNMMFDPEPTHGEDAKWILQQDGKEIKATFGGTRDDGSERWTNHFDTCPAKEGRPERPKAAPQNARPAASVAAQRKGVAAVEVTVTFGDLIFSGTCTLVPHPAVTKAEAPADDPDAFDPGSDL